MLRAAHADATFFLVGRNLAGRARLVKSELRLGALGDHTWSHSWLPELTVAASRRQLAKAQAAIARATGSVVQLFRPPYGARDATVDAQARSLGMLDVLWSVDTRDSEGASWAEIGAAVREALRPGSIVLMHENHGQTLRALKFVILPMLKRRGYTAVSIPSLLALDPPNRAQRMGNCFGSVR